MLRGNADLVDYTNIFAAKLEYDTIPDSNFTDSPDQSFKFENTNRTQNISSIMRVQYGECESRVSIDDIKDKV